MRYSKKRLWRRFFWIIYFISSISLSWSLTIVASSNFRSLISSSNCNLSCLVIMSFSFLVIRLRRLTLPLLSAENPCASSSSVFTDSRFLILEVAILGVMPCFSLWACWTPLRRYVSRNDFVIASVNWSAYRITSHFGFLEARHMFWTKAVVERRKPCLSASNMAINETSGRSIPSLRRFIQTIISISPDFNFLIISRRSMVAISLWR